MSRNLILELMKTAEADPLPSNISYSLNLEATTAVSSISIVVYAAFLILMVFYNRGDERVYCFGSPNNLIFISLGVMISTIASLSVPHYNQHFFDVYTIILLTLVGVVTVVTGSHLFFSLPSNDQQKTLCYHHRNMSLFIWIVTIPLVLIEFVEFIGNITINVNAYKAGVVAGASVQKLVQASIYHFSLRLKVPCENKKEGAVWYLRVISLFNYAMWLDSIIRGYDDSIQVMFGRGFAILGNAMTALLIDYRLLCCLLFAEHSLEVYEKMDATKEEEIQKIVLVNNVAEFGLRSSQMSGFGYVFGFVLISLQLVCGLQYYGHVGVWSNIFPIIADIIVVTLGFMLLRQKGSVFTSSAWRKTDAKGVDMMVAMMGISGFLYWLVMSIFNLSWAYKVTDIDDKGVVYLKWSCAKNIVRSISIILQLYIFMKCDPYFGCRDGVKEKKRSYFILPAIMLSFLSVFIMAIMDSHSVVVKELVETSNISQVLRTLIEVSEPLYLGFCLHLFLHFFIVNNNMRSLKACPRHGNELSVIPLV